uniref:Cysteine-rich DPF motif domain-containing protein 1 n=1 Tax=Setaria digitata TaxID=48799 RepID=A0A915Q062_9BILA
MRPRSCLRQVLLEMDTPKSVPTYGHGAGSYDLKEDGNANTVKFTCFLCGLTENCLYGLVKVSSRTHIYRYKDEMYYMLDPFRNRSGMDERRVIRTRATVSSKMSGGNKTPSIFDNFVLGAICSVCGQPVCIAENCSVFYTKTFCIVCATRGKAHFPKDLVKQIDAAQKEYKIEQEEVKIV